jgi:hypothetical protein
MSEEVKIIGVEKDGDDGLIVTFSDRTAAGYLAEELLELRPFREPVPRRLPFTASPAIALERNQDKYTHRRF